LRNSIAAQLWYLVFPSHSNSFVVLHWVCHDDCNNGKSDCRWFISLWKRYLCIGTSICQHPTSSPLHGRLLHCI
jgi:hypothetical protein